MEKIMDDNDIFIPVDRSVNGGVFTVTMLVCLHSVSLQETLKY